MQFVVIGHDYKDEKALERRMAVRDAHLKFAGEMFEQGKWLFASALLDEDGNMNGSIIFVDYPSQEVLRKEWLDNEAYITGKVWEKVIVKKAKISIHK